jgi:hypothetical protein
MSADLLLIDYGNDWFCTQDAAKAAGAASILSNSNRSWLSQKHNIAFVRPEDLVNMIDRAKK